MKTFAALLCAALLFATPGLTQVPDFAAQSTLPINLDATSSELDRGNDRLVFQNPHITQGTMSITADMAEATRIDFENSNWQFRGNVVIENQGARAHADAAELLFLGHELRKATLNGSPARFEQSRPDGQHTEGRANVMHYDVPAAIIQLTENAWVSDGTNETSSDSIVYDMRRETWTAAGQVHIKIEPPPRDDKKTGKPP